MQALYSVAEIVAATGGRPVNCGDGDVTAVSIDSRDIPPGGLFVAIKGDRFDGHDFVAKAIAAGATAALVSENKAEDLKDLPLIVVPDALEGLVALARFARERSHARIIAVTGSAGKTSTKDALAAICAAEGKTHAAIKSFNNHWGVPLTLARMPADAVYGIFEIGMNHAGEISPLVQLVRPEAVVITAIAPAHIAYLGSLDAIARAKAEIFDGLVPGGVAFVNADHGQLDIIRSVADKKGISRFVTYGYADNADVRLISVGRGDTGLNGQLSGPDIDVRLETSFAGRHHLANVAGAVLAAQAVGIAPQNAARSVSSLREGDGRGAITQLGDGSKPLTLVDESFNANPASMRAALEVFADLPAPPGKKILVLGDMLELGEVAQSMHEELADAVIAAGADSIYLVGPQMRYLTEKLVEMPVTAHAETTGELQNTVLAALDYGDLVMVKGSKGIGLAPLVNEIRSRFGGTVK